MSSRNWAFTAVIFVQLFYGFTFTFANDVIDGGFIKPFGFILLRVCAATVLFWIFGFMAPKEKIETKDYGLVFLGALFGVAVNMQAFFKGLAFTTPINASVIMITTPIIVLILSYIFLREFITKLKVIGIFIGLSGAVVLSVYGKPIHNGDHILLGNFLIFINALSYSAYLIIIKKLTFKYHPYTIIKWIFLIGIFMVVPLGLEEIIIVDWQSFPPYIWFSVFFVIVFATFATYILNPLALRSLSATTVSSFIYLQPTFAGIFAVAMGSDILSPVKILAATLIFTGVFFVSKPSKIIAQ